MEKANENLSAFQTWKTFPLVENLFKMEFRVWVFFFFGSSLLKWAIYSITVQHRVYCSLYGYIEIS